MKTWLIRHKRPLFTWGIVAAMAVAFFLGWHAGANATDRKAYAVLWEAMIDLSDPERCALCSEERRYQAPCLINLSTGQMGEMKVYTYGPTSQGKLDPREERFSATFSFPSCAGLTSARDTYSHTCKVPIPAKRELINPALFCKECRQLLAGAGLEGYVILDLYDRDHMQAYPLRDETIRDYRITIHSGTNGSVELCVTGMLEY